MFRLFIGTFTQILFYTVVTIAIHSFLIIKPVSALSVLQITSTYPINRNEAMAKINLTQEFPGFTGAVGIFYYKSEDALDVHTNKKAETVYNLGESVVILKELEPKESYVLIPYVRTPQSGYIMGDRYEFTMSSASFSAVYATFGTLRYNKYASPFSLYRGDYAYLKNYVPSDITLIQVFLYDYNKKGNQGFTKSSIKTNSMYLRTNYLLPVGKRYAYVFKFKDKTSEAITTKYFVVYTTKSWLGKSTL